MTPSQRELLSKILKEKPPELKELHSYGSRIREMVADELIAIIKEHLPDYSEKDLSRLRSQLLRNIHMRATVNRISSLALYQLGFTQRAIAIILNIKQPAVSNYLRGKRGTNLMWVLLKEHKINIWDHEQEIATKVSKKLIEAKIVDRISQILQKMALHYP